MAALQTCMSHFQRASNFHKAYPGGRSGVAGSKREFIGVLFVLSILAFVLGLWSRGSSEKASAVRQLVGTGGAPDTLLTYVFSNTDEQYLPNLKFFVDFGIREYDGCEYIILVQTGPDIKVSMRWPVRVKGLMAAPGTGSKR
jgi:hypothetical protein